MRSSDGVGWLILVPLISLGCGTFLSVKGVDQECPNPGGIAINQRAVYTPVITGGAVAALKLVEGTEAEARLNELVLVDPEHLMGLGWWRMPFASAELGIELGANQLLKKVSLDSKTGATRAAAAAAAGVDAAGQVKALEK